jgi:hypothetical protein
VFEHVREQPWAVETALDPPTRRRGLRDVTAARAGELAPHMTEHTEACRHILGLF